MSRWECLLMCVFISNESQVPLELLWWDNHLTLLGAFCVISLSIGLYNKFINAWNKL